MKLRFHVFQDFFNYLTKISSEIASNFKGKKILITGSNGKTTTTNIISKSLPKCSSTIKNFNNEIGLPISIMSAKKDSKYFVLEAGAAKKEISNTYQRLLSLISELLLILETHI